MLRPFQQSYHIPGTLTANIVITFTAPFNCVLRHVSVGGSNANDATLKIGTSADDDEFLTATAIGDSGTPVEFDEAGDFRYDVWPRIEDGDKVICTIDYDGSSGTAAHDVTLVLTFEEG